jgi:hypothetical protein
MRNTCSHLSGFLSVTMAIQRHNFPYHLFLAQDGTELTSPAKTKKPSLQKDLSFGSLAILVF